MNAGLCIKHNKNVIFTDKHDFILCGHDIEVKTLFKEVSKTHNEKYPLLNSKLSSVESENLFLSTVKEFMRTPKILDEHLKKGIIEQGGKLVFLNVILDNMSPIFTAFSEYNTIDLDFSHAIQIGLNGIRQDGVVPIIISFHAIHNEYTVFSSSINVAIEDGSLKII